jgi:CoA-transferase family III
VPFRGKLAVLARDADIFVQGYWPGAIAALGRDPEKVAKIRPGIIYVSLCAFDASEPKPLPGQALDHATGYLVARRTWRLVACARLVGADRSLAAPARAHRWHGLYRSEV